MSISAKEVGFRLHKTDGTSNQLLKASAPANQLLA
jgi:hypothetical protein